MGFSVVVFRSIFHWELADFFPFRKLMIICVYYCWSLLLVPGVASSSQASEYLHPDLIFNIFVAVFLLNENKSVSFFSFPAGKIKIECRAKTLLYIVMKWTMFLSI